MQEGIATKHILYTLGRDIRGSFRWIFDKKEKSGSGEVLGGLAEGLHLGLEALQEVVGVLRQEEGLDLCQEFPGLKSDGLRQNGAALIQLKTKKNFCCLNLMNTSALRLLT